MRERISRTFFWLGLYVFLLALAGASFAETYTIQLHNGAEIGIDEQTGCIVRLSHPATGIMLSAQPETAGLLDVAYPAKEFFPLRLASQFSKARLTKEPDGIRIIYDRLGPSRENVELPEGKVVAQVIMRAAPDGRSLIMSCQILNASDAPIPQILFPDLWGLKAFDGPSRAKLKFSGRAGEYFPFQGEVAYTSQTGWRSEEEWTRHKGCDNINFFNLRWMDLGSLKGGLSIYHKKWGSYPKANILTHRGEFDPQSLRLMWEHSDYALQESPEREAFKDVPRVKQATSEYGIGPGKTWDSGEFWLTPHAGGWAKGIEPFRAYVNQVNPPRQLPRHIRDGLGFQSVWMIQPWEPDPAQAAFRYEDLPRIARDAKQHGLDEVVVWGWCDYCKLPIPTLSQLGTREQWLDGVKKAKEMGVNIVPYLGLHSMVASHAEKYLGTLGNGNYPFIYHNELVPQLGPNYAGLVPEKIYGIPPTNKLWQKDIVAELTRWIEEGVTCFGVDVFGQKNLFTGEKPEIVDIAEEIRGLAREKDPESTFSGEQIGNTEWDNRVFDYTWNWDNKTIAHREADPLLNVLPRMRINYNIYRSPLAAKKGFAAGFFLNFMLSKPGRANGTALLSEDPALSATAKELAKLRKQFLPYFVEGIALGECILSEPVIGGFVRGHQLDDKLLVIAINTANQVQELIIHSNLALWLPSANGYVVKTYDSTGELLKTERQKSDEWTMSSPLLEPAEMCFFEIESE